MRKAKQAIEPEFRFTDCHELRKHFTLGKSVEAKLRQTLPKGIYWQRLPDGRKTLWNLRLVVDYLRNGDTPEHRALVERYLQSLEQSA